MFEPGSDRAGGNDGYRAALSTAISTKRAADALVRIEKLLRGAPRNTLQQTAADAMTRYMPIDEAKGELDPAQWYAPVTDAPQMYGVILSEIQTLFGVLTPEHEFGKPLTNKELQDLWRDRLGPVLRKNSKAREYAARLLLALRSKHYPDGPPIEPASDIMTIIDQIDHLTTGLCRPQLPDNTKQTHEQLVALFETMRVKWWPQSTIAPNDITSLLIEQLTTMVNGLGREVQPTHTAPGAHAAAHTQAVRMLGKLYAKHYPGMAYVTATTTEGVLLQIENTVEGLTRDPGTEHPAVKLLRQMRSDPFLILGAQYNRAIDAICPTV